MPPTKTATRACPACGYDMRQETRRRNVRYGGRSVEIDQPAWWCSACGEDVLVSADAKVADRAFAPRSR